MKGAKSRNCEDHAVRRYPAGRTDSTPMPIFVKFDYDPVTHYDEYPWIAATKPEKTGTN
jgi:hypothetical protein